MIHEIPPSIADVRSSYPVSLDMTLADHVTKSMPILTTFSLSIGKKNDPDRDPYQKDPDRDIPEGK